MHPQISQEIERINLPMSKKRYEVVAEKFKVLWVNSDQALEDLRDTSSTLWTLVKAIPVGKIGRTKGLLRFPKFLATMNRRSKVLTVLIFVGMILTGLGVGFFLQYLGGYHENLSLIKTGMTLGANPTGDPSVQTPLVNMIVTPDTTSNGFATLSIGFNSWIWTNKSFPVIFAIISPLTIAYEYKSAEWADTPDPSWAWSVQDLGGNASVIMFTSTPGATIPYGMRAGPLRGGSAFQVGNLLYRDDRGAHTLVLPFGVGISQAVTHSIVQLGIGTVTRFNVSLTLNLGLNFVITNSSPAYDSLNAYSYNGTYPARQSLTYLLNGKSSLILSYADPSEVDRFANLQAIGLLLLGIGVPVIITTPFEMFRNYQRKSRPENESRPTVVA